MIDRDPRFDGRVLAGGIVVTGLLAGGGAALLARVNRPGDELGPTAATLTDFWNIALGAALGFLLGTAGVAVAVRRGSRMVSAITCGAVAYVVVMAIFDAGTEWSGVGDAIAFGLMGGILMGIPILLGAMIGGFIGGLRDGFRRARVPSHDPGNR